MPGDAVAPGENGRGERSTDVTTIPTIIGLEIGAVKGVLKEVGRTSTYLIFGNLALRPELEGLDGALD